MKTFSSALTMKIGYFAGIISFCITAFKSFNHIGEFHGNIVELMFYLLEGLSSAFFNGALSFCICALLVFFPVKLLENRMHWYYMDKQNKEQERLLKERKDQEGGDQKQQQLL